MNSSKSFLKLNPLLQSEDLDLDLSTSTLWISQWILPLPPAVWKIRNLKLALWFSQSMNFSSPFEHKSAPAVWRCSSPFQTTICYCSLKIRLNLSLVQLLLTIYSSEGSRRKRQASNLAWSTQLLNWQTLVWDDDTLATTPLLIWGGLIECCRSTWMLKLPCSRRVWRETASKELLVRRVEKLQWTRQRKVGGTEEGCLR